MTASEEVVVAILRPGATEPEEREMPKEPRHIQRLFRRVRREGPVQACYEAGVSGYDLYRQITACQARRHRGGTMLQDGTTSPRGQDVAGRGRGDAWRLLQN